MTHSPLRPQPVVTAETRAFWDGAGKGQLCLRRCIGCGRLAAPLAPRCVNCLGEDFEVETLSGRVALKGRTVLHLQPLPGREGPLVIAECTVEEDPSIVLIALDETGATEGAAPGALLSLVFAKADDGIRFASVRPAGERAE